MSVARRVPHLSSETGRWTSAELDKVAQLTKASGSLAAELRGSVDEDYHRRRQVAFVQGMIQFSDPVHCREAHPDTYLDRELVECTSPRAHQEIFGTPHRSATGVEWFSAHCRGCFPVPRKDGSPCPDCGGTGKRIVNALDSDEDELA